MAQNQENYDTYAGGKPHLEHSKSFLEDSTTKPISIRPSSFYVVVGFVLATIALFTSLYFAVWRDIQLPLVPEKNGPIMGYDGSYNWHHVGPDVNGPPIKPNIEFGEIMTMSRQGNRFAVATPSYDNGEVTIWERSSDNEWTTVANRIRGTNSIVSVGLSISLSKTGAFIAVASSAGVTVYKENSSTEKWEVFGDNTIGLLPSTEVIKVVLTDDAKGVAMLVTGDFGAKVMVYEYTKQANEAKENLWILRGSEIPGQTSNISQPILMDMSDAGDRIAFASGSDIAMYYWEDTIESKRWAPMLGNKARITLEEPVTTMDLSGDGSRLAVSFCDEDTGTVLSDTVMVFEEDTEPEFPGNWVNIGGELNNVQAGELFGCTSVSLSRRGRQMAVGAPARDGLPGVDTGYTFVYQFGTFGMAFDEIPSWKLLGGPISGELAEDASGTTVVLSGSGSIVAIAAPLNDNENGENAGSIRVYEFRSAE